MAELDLHAGVKKLAEAEWAYPACKDGIADRSYGHFDLCNGSSLLVPFESLRVRCPRCEGDGPRYGCPQCCLEGNLSILGRGWVPEPDPEKACWRIWKMLPNRLKQVLADLPFGEGSDSWEEAVIRAALAWLEEQEDVTVRAYESSTND